MWGKIQQEVLAFYKDKQQYKVEKLKIDEENKLSLVAYIIIKAQNPLLFATFKALMPFIKQAVIEEAAPLVTFETAFNAIFQEYNDSVKNESEQNSNKHNGSSNNFEFAQTPAFEEQKLFGKQQQNNINNMDTASQYQAVRNLANMSVFSKVSRVSMAMFNQRGEYKKKLRDLRN